MVDQRFQRERERHEPTHKFELTIKKRDVVSWTELSEIVQIVDSYILETAIDYDEFFFDGRRRFRYARSYTSRPFDPTETVRNTSFVSVTSVKSGSIIFTLALGAAAAFPIWALSSGIRRSRLGEELQRLGKNAGNILADGLSVVNGQLEDWSSASSALRDEPIEVEVQLLTHDPDNDPPFGQP